MTTTLHLGAEGSRLILPVVPPAPRPVPAYLPIGPPEAHLPGFEPLDTGTPSGYGEIESVERNPRSGKARVVATSTSAERFPWGEQSRTESITHEAEDGKPESASVRGDYTTEVKLPERTLRWECTVQLRSDRDNFYYENSRRLWKDGVLVREKSWKETFPRDFQ
jgi:hypothetical protein